MAAFRIGINMAGAVSAGAYTAGVLDFLTEALDAWHAAMDKGAGVPRHEVTIEVLSGASAGGMCAAMGSMLLSEDFEHIHDTQKTGTSNRLYESWVNKIDIRPMLGTDDLKGGKVVSLLDSSIIASIADYALTPGKAMVPARRYVSRNLTLFLSLTNLRGVNYSLTGFAAGSAEETTFFYGDKIRFPGDGTADLAKLKTAAMATGAFPVFLAPRVLERMTDDYTPPLWEAVSSKSTSPMPNFKGLPDKKYVTLNVDGGVTNNSPCNTADEYLTALDEKNDDHGRDALLVNRAVINVAPFPTTDAFEPKYDPEKNAGVFSVVSQLFGALVAQARFYGESLSGFMRGQVFDRYVIAPSGDKVALQCAALGAFGGFFSRKFRAHDYALGRRNCQQFLRQWFVLPKTNAVIGAGLEALDPAVRAAVEKDYSVRDPGTYAQPDGAGATDWMPIIPLCSKSVLDDAPAPVREKLTGKELDEILGLMSSRFQAVMKVMSGEIQAWALRAFLAPGPWFIAKLSKDPVRKALVKALGGDFAEK